jgi:hypothetical protein
VGVERGFAGAKFSGSIREKGLTMQINKKKKKKISILVASLKEK